jgi:hypothetical protein
MPWAQAHGDSVGPQITVAKQGCLDFKLSFTQITVAFEWCWHWPKFFPVDLERAVNSARMQLSSFLYQFIYLSSFFNSKPCVSSTNLVDIEHFVSFQSADA